MLFLSLSLSLSTLEKSERENADKSVEGARDKASVHAFAVNRTKKVRPVDCHPADRDNVSKGKLARDLRIYSNVPFS